MGFGAWSWMFGNQQAGFRVLSCFWIQSVKGLGYRGSGSTLKQRCLVNALNSHPHANR